MRQNAEVRLGIDVHAHTHTQVQARVFLLCHGVIVER